MARPPRPKPNDGAGAEWLMTKRPDPVQEVARQFVLNVKRVMGDRSVRATAKMADLDHNTLRYVLDGTAWPDMIVIAKLERAFHENLWPGLVDDD
jgi:lambda repressor-like predicted transcriptional regulator